MSSTQRGADIVGAIAGLVVFAPVMAVVAVAIRLDDGGAVFFRQRRLGAGRQPFTILKFRSMHEGRVTRVGRVLRDCGLDELPQFFNILRGDMSAVGPRPLTPEDVERFGWTGPSFDYRWQCRPGLIGLAQLLGARADADALQFDRVHVAGRNAALEVELIAWAFAVNVFGKARVRRWLLDRLALREQHAGARHD